MPKVWDKFEWDDENKKNGNVQHLREHGIEPEEAEECFFHGYIFVRTSDSPISIFWMAAQTVVDVCGSFSKIKAIGSRGFSPVGTYSPEGRENDEETIWQIV
jgi:hypothetical protein